MRMGVKHFRFLNYSIKFIIHACNVCVCMCVREYGISFLCVCVFFFLVLFRVHLYVHMQHWRKIIVRLRIFVLLSSSSSSSSFFFTFFLFRKFHSQSLSFFLVSSFFFCFFLFSFFSFFFWYYNVSLYLRLRVSRNADWNSSREIGRRILEMSFGSRSEKRRRWKDRKRHVSQ